MDCYVGVPSPVMAKTIVSMILLLFTSVPAYTQNETPEILSVDHVVAGAQRITTLYAHAMGKWSDADKHLAVMSTEIHCYERFGLCEEADATYSGGSAGTSLSTFDILRWNGEELIAVDSSPICVVNTLRFDFKAKKVGITMASKGDTRDSHCKDVKATTAFLGGLNDEPEKFGK